MAEGTQRNVRKSLKLSITERRREHTLGFSDCEEDGEKNSPEKQKILQQGKRL